MKGYVTVGKITKTHGLFGSVKVQPTTNVLEVFDNFKEIFIHDEARDEIYKVQVEEIKKAGKAFLVKFFGVDNEEKAKKIVGMDVVMRVEDLPELKSPDEYYYYEILGVDVLDQEGNFLGKVCDIISTGSNEVLIVKNKDEEILLPMVRDYILEVHRQKRLVVKIPEWI